MKNDKKNKTPPRKTRANSKALTHERILEESITRGAKAVTTDRLERQKARQDRNKARAIQAQQTPQEQAAPVDPQTPPNESQQIQSTRKKTPPPWFMITITDSSGNIKERGILPINKINNIELRPDQILHLRSIQGHTP